MVCKFLLLYRYVLGISLSMSFLLTFMDSVVRKKLTHSIVYIQCCWLSTWKCIKCFVPGGSSPEEREWWGRDMLLLALRALEWHQYPLRLLHWHPPQVLVFLQGIVLKFYDWHYWLGKKKRGGIFSRHLRIVLISHFPAGSHWPFHCKIKYHF